MIALQKLLPLLLSQLVVVITFIAAALLLKKPRVAWLGHTYSYQTADKAQITWTAMPKNLEF